MPTACPCFGRNENCRLCNGSGLVTHEVESKVANSQEFKVFSRQMDPQNASGGAAVNAYKWRETGAEREASEARRREADEATARYAAIERERERRDEERAEKNLRRRKLKAELEANLEAVLIAKRAGLVRDGPYRCNRCKWIHDGATGPCELCGAEDGYTEAV
jgi:hypothetical protein